ncbi:hypothetical protein MTO96_050196, partial [Rhipicephalus appendiculatus]
AGERGRVPPFGQLGTSAQADGEPEAGTSNGTVQEDAECGERKVSSDEAEPERQCEKTRDYGDADRRAPLGEPTVDEALAKASVEDDSWQRPTRAAKGAKSQAIETAAAAATKANANEEATEEKARRQ